MGVHNIYINKHANFVMLYVRCCQVGVRSTKPKPQIGIRAQMQRTDTRTHTHTHTATGSPSPAAGG